MKNISIYIDAEYVIQSIRALKGKPPNTRIFIEDIDWEFFISYIINGRNIRSTYYYTARLDLTENKETFDRQTKYLSEVEVKLKLYNLTLRLNKMKKKKIKKASTWDKNRNDDKHSSPEYTWVQKGTDAKVVMDLLRDFYESDIDSFILISGDEDFAEVLEYLKDKGKEIELISFDRDDGRISANLAAIPNKVDILTYKKIQELDLIKKRHIK